MVTEELQKKINKSIERLRAFCPPGRILLSVLRRKRQYRVQAVVN